jgi:hypothetical protein
MKSVSPWLAELSVRAAKSTIFTSVQDDHSVINTDSRQNSRNMLEINPNPNIVFLFQCIYATRAIPSSHHSLDLTIIFQILPDVYPRSARYPNQYVDHQSLPFHPVQRRGICRCAISPLIVLGVRQKDRVVVRIGVEVGMSLQLFYMASLIESAKKPCTHDSRNKRS